MPPTPRSRLTGFEQVLLGMIFIQPSTGYDLEPRSSTIPLGVYEPSSGALYPALDRLDRRGLLPLGGAAADRGRQAAAALPPDRGRAGRPIWTGSASRWCRRPLPKTCACNLLRFVMMAQVLPEEAVVGFLDQPADGAGRVRRRA